MKLEAYVADPRPDYIANLLIESVEDYGALREAILACPHPFPFKGEYEVAARLKEELKRQQEKPPPPSEEGLTPEEIERNKMERAEILRITEELLATDDHDVPMLPHTEAWLQLREETRRHARMTLGGFSEDLPKAHRSLMEKISDIVFDDNAIMAIGEDELMAVSELLEAFIVKKVKERRAKEKDQDEEEESAGGSPSETAGDKIIDPMIALLRELEKFLLGVKSQTSKIRAKRKEFIKVKTKQKSLGRGGR